MDAQRGKTNLGEGPVVVATPQEFVPHLRDGDVLLFDKLGHLNRLVQWGDNRPAGHVGVWYDGAVYEATMKPAPDGRSQGGVWPTPFAEIMDLMVDDARGRVAMVRTVTARRHRGISDDDRRAIHQYLRGVTEDDSGYGYRDAVLLTPFALERSRGRAGESDIEVSYKVIQACAYLAKKRLRAPAVGQELFCSQLVYQAYEHAGLSVEITEPLYTRYHSRHHFAPFRGGEGDERPVGPDDPEMARLLDEYDAIFERDVMSELIAAEAPERPVLDEADFVPLAGFATLGSDTSEHPDASMTRARRRRPQLGDMVTPGDFWSSPSFDSVAVLHRPAGI
jgi:hypothetical protein